MATTAKEADFTEWAAGLEGLVHEGEESGLLRSLGARVQTLCSGPGPVFGVAGEGERAATIVVELQRHISSESVQWRTVQLGASPADDNPLADIWLIVLVADQLGSLAEREFVESLGPAVAEQAVLCVRTERAPQDRIEDILKYARDLFGPLGVRPEHVVLVGAGQDDSAEIDVSGIVDLVQAGVERSDILRGFVLEASGNQALSALRKLAAAVDALLKAQPRLIDEERRRDDFVLAARTARESLEASAEEMPNRMREALEQDWNSWAEDLKAVAAGGGLSRASVREELSEFVNGKLLPRLGVELERHIAELAREIPAVAEDLRGLPIQTEGELDAVAVPRPTARRRHRPGTRAVAGVALVGAAGLAGWLLGGRLALLLTGASAASALYYFMRSQAPEKAVNGSAEWERARGELDRQLEQLCEQVVREAVHAFRERCDTRSHFLDDAVAEAAKPSDERIRLEAAAKELAAVVDSFP